MDGLFNGGFLRYRFGGLIFGGACTWRALFSEFYGQLHNDGFNTYRDMMYSTKHETTALEIHSDKGHTFSPSPREGLTFPILTQTRVVLFLFHFRNSLAMSIHFLFVSTILIHQANFNTFVFTQYHLKTIPVCKYPSLDVCKVSTVPVLYLV